MTGKFDKLAGDYVRLRFAAEQARRARGKANNRRTMNDYHRGRFPADAEYWHERYIKASRAGAAIRRELNRRMRAERKAAGNVS